MPAFSSAELTFTSCHLEISPASCRGGVGWEAMFFPGQAGLAALTVGGDRLLGHWSTLSNLSVELLLNIYFPLAFCLLRMQSTKSTEN